MFIYIYNTLAFSNYYVAYKYFPIFYCTQYDKTISDFIAYLNVFLTVHHELTIQ